MSVSSLITANGPIIRVDAKALRLDVDTIVGIVDPLYEWEKGVRINHTDGLVDFFPKRRAGMIGADVAAMSYRKMADKINAALTFRVIDLDTREPICRIDYVSGAKYKIQLSAATGEIDPKVVRALAASMRSLKKVKSVEATDSEITVVTWHGRRDDNLVESLQQIVLHKMTQPVKKLVKV